jgi:hypothetical protein
MNALKVVLFVAFLATGLASAAAQDVAQSDGEGLQQRIANINAAYDAEWKEIAAEGERIKDKAPGKVAAAVNIDVKCKSKEHQIKLDIPEVSMKTQKWSLDLPQTSMKTHSIKWDNPETFVANTTCGYYPRISRGHIRMKPIICKLPQVRMVKREAKFDVPEFKWDTTSLKLDIPEFKMVTQTWKFDLPDCKVTKVSAEVKEMEDDSARLGARADALAARQQTEIAAVVAEENVAARLKVQAQFDDGIAKLQEAILKIKENGIDPSHVRQEDGTFVDLYAQLVDLQKRRNEELAKFDQFVNATEPTA